MAIRKYLAASKGKKLNRSTNNFYNNFSFLYPLVDIFLKPQKKRLFEEINDLPSGNLLEIGVGNGSHLSLYKTHKITAIDTSSAMLAQAKRKQQANVMLLDMNGENLQFSDHSFDYVVLSHVITVVEDPEKLLEESYRVLKPNGKIFILNHFTPENWLRHIDKSFNIVSRNFHFRSLFCMDDLKAIKKFKLLKEIGFGKFSYFKLLIFCKA